MYRPTWLSAVALAGVVGVWGSVRALSLGGAVTLFLITGLGAACIGMTADEDSPPPSWRAAARLGVDWGAAVVAGVGLIAALGAFGLLVVVALVLSSPKALAAARRYRLQRRGRAGGSGQDQAPYDEPTGIGRNRRSGTEHDTSPAPESSLLHAPWLEQQVQSMDDPTLCFAWRMSYVAMQRPLSSPLRQRIVERRQEFLDELERRHPRGFAAWLDSGARAAGDPSRFISDAEWRTDH